MSTQPLRTLCLLEVNALHPVQLDLEVTLLKLCHNGTHWLLQREPSLFKGFARAKLVIIRLTKRACLDSVLRRTVEYAAIRRGVCLVLLDRDTQIHASLTLSVGGAESVYNFVFAVEKAALFPIIICL